MTTQADFSAQEWLLLGDAPLAAAAAVALADPGGGERETAALLEAWRAAEELFAACPLLVELIRDLDPQVREERETARGGHPPRRPRAASVLDEAQELCRQAVALLERRATPDERAAYQQFVVALAEAVAHAERSGGLLGLGGVTVTLEEQRALRAVRFALDYTPPEMQL